MIVNPYDGSGEARSVSAKYEMTGLELAAGSQASTGRVGMTLELSDDTYRLDSTVDLRDLEWSKLLETKEVVLVGDRIEEAERCRCLLISTPAPGTLEAPAARGRHHLLAAARLVSPTAALLSMIGRLCRRSDS